MEPKPSEQYQANPPEQPRAVPLVLSLDWAQVLRRQQQLLNQNSDIFVRIFRDENGLVRIDLND